MKRTLDGEDVSWIAAVAVGTALGVAIGTWTTSRIWERKLPELCQTVSCEAGGRE